MKKAIDLYNNIEEKILVIGIVVMVLILFVQVVLRFVFSSPFTWAEELARLIFIWISWLGISIGQRKLEHIKVTMLTDRLKGKSQFTVLFLADIVSMAILIVFIWQGVNLVVTIFEMGTKTAALHIPRWTVYLSVPVSCLAMGLRLAADMAKNIAGLRKGA